MENGLRTKHSSNIKFPVSKSFRDVLSGNFPEYQVNKMSICELEAFVLKLVKFTSAKAGASAVSTVNSVNYKKPIWWPRDVLFDTSLPNKDKDQRKQFRLTLRRVIVKCCEFFRNRAFKPRWPPNGGISWENDENFDTIKTRGIKRKITDIALANNVKKRKTLVFKNERALEVQQIILRPCEAVIRLQDILHPPENKPPNQQQFLNIFGLCHNNNYVAPTPKVPQISRYVKLHNCPHIPLSSDVGQAIIKRENYSLPEYATARRSERLEWYINKKGPKKMEQNYEVSFVDNKVVDYHYYKFPKRQQHQLGCNVRYNEFLLKLCRPLSVVIESDNLDSKKKWYDSLKIEVSISRLSTNELNNYLCKDFKIVLKKKLYNTRPNIRKPIRLTPS